MHSHKTANLVRAKLAHATSGISIIEVLVAVVISSFAILVSSFIISSLGLNIRSTESVYDTQNAIDQNLSRIESAADRYKCELSGGTLSCSVTTDSVPNKDAYITVSDSAAWTAFSAKCNQTTATGGNDLITPLKTYINSDTNLSVPSNIFREITVHGADSAQGLTYVRHMTIQYRAGSTTGQVLRDVTIMPTIVSYCP